MTTITYTPEELAEFDRITLRASSPDQVTRIAGRLELSRFRGEHGEEKCKAMFAEIERKDAAKRKRKRK